LIYRKAEFPEVAFELTPVESKAMIMTSEAVRHERKRIDALIDALERSYPTATEDVEDISWLKEQRKYFCALLAVRRAQRAQKLVNLDIWRTGRGSRVAVAAD
jgi:hypothetical protein